MKGAFGENAKNTLIVHALRARRSEHFPTAFATLTCARKNFVNCVGLSKICVELFLFIASTVNNLNVCSDLLAVPELISEFGLRVCYDPYGRRDQINLFSLPCALRIIRLKFKW